VLYMICLSVVMAGEDVTYNARNLTGIPQVLPELHGDTNLHASVVEVRGEVYMTLHDFQELNAVKVINPVTWALSVSAFILCRRTQY
jgi:NAD-dependent DNA ligase